MINMSHYAFLPERKLIYLREIYLEYTRSKYRMAKGHTEDDDIYEFTRD